MWSEIWKCAFFSINNKDFQSSNVSSGWLSFKQPIMWNENNDNTKLQLLYKRMELKCTTAPRKSEKMWL